MNIFIDESGSFVNAPNLRAFNAIAAYMSPESDRRELRKILASLKRSVGAPANSEIKLRAIDERKLFVFLKQLSQLSGALFAVATDAGLNQPSEVRIHQTAQAVGITEHIDKMLHQAAKDGIQALADRMSSLPQQLYVQLQCQVRLLDLVVRNGVLYFVQRTPRCLSTFRWRIDQKNSSKTEYESAFQTVLPAFLQSSSLRDPMIALAEADYSAFSRFQWTAETKPTYLRDAYGIETNDNALPLNIGMLFREDLCFVDSKSNLGVQVADILASSIRRCLRYEFTDNETAAALLGSLMVQNFKARPPIQLLGFSSADQVLDKITESLVRLMESRSRVMLAQ